jgi:hypothetical protein
MRGHGRARYLWALPLPLTLFAVSLDFLAARGPFWLGTNSDPSYVYLLNAVRVTEGGAPAHLDHPGVTVHLLGALVVQTSHALASRPHALADDVLRDPEWYARAIVVSFLGLYAATLALAGALVLRATGRLALMAMVQSTPLLSPSCFFELTDLKPEPLLFVCAGLVAAALAASFAGDAADGTALAVALGVLTGAAVASKSTALSLAAVPLVVLAGARLRLVWAGACAASFLLLAVPAWPEWRRAFSFLGQLAGGSGLYGRGLLAETRPYLGSLRRVLVEEAPFFLVLLVSAAAAWLAWRRAGSDAAQRRWATRILVGLIATGCVQVALLLKHPYQPRYLLPALGLTGTMLALATWLTCWSEEGRADRRACAAVIALCALIAAVQLPRFARRRAEVRRAADCQVQARLHAERSAEGACVLVSHYRASSLPLALHQGDAWTRHAFVERLERLGGSERFLEDDGRIAAFGPTPGAAAPAGCTIQQGWPGRPGGEILFACPWEEVRRFGQARERPQASDSTGSPLRMGNSP